MHGDDQDDSALISCFLAGEEHAFDKLVVRYQERVMNVCYRLIGDYDEACDCAQETFIKVFRTLGSFRHESSFYTWLHRIAVNTCKNRLSSAKYRRNRKMVSLSAPGGGRRGHRGVDPPNGAPSPELQVERRETDLLIQDAIDSLEGEQKSIVVLRDIEGLSYEEVSLATGLPVGTVKSKLSRAREKLREKLKGII